jgi:hypothetical protein
MSDQAHESLVELSYCILTHLHEPSAHDKDRIQEDQDTSSPAWHALRQHET